MHSLIESLPSSALALEVEGDDEDEDGDEAGQEEGARGQVTEVKHLQGGRGIVGATTNEHTEKESR